ncbi:MAG TPA: DUF397 domain-containing protein [Pseudonocardia sp.]
MYPRDARWRKSSFSGNHEDGASCVEVALVAEGVALRDTKNRALAPHRYPAAEWRAFLAALRSGEWVVKT